jgi:hypothetical protein
MRTFLQALYRITLKFIGALGLLLFFVFLMVVLPGNEDRNLLHPVPLTMTGILVLVSLALTNFQARLPDCLARPSRPWHAGIVFAAGLVVGAATMVAVMLPLTSIGLDLGMDDKTMRPMTINTALLFGSLYTLATFMGVVLSLWPAAETGREQFA